MVRVILLLAVLVLPTFLSANSGSFQFSISNPRVQTSETTVVRFMSEATELMDKDLDESLQASGPLALFTTSNEGTELKINSYPELTQDYSLTLHIRVAVKGKYILNYSTLKALPSNMRIFLLDRVTQKSHPIQYAFPLMVELSPGEDDRFELLFSKPAKIEVVQNPCGKDKKSIVVVSDLGNKNWNYLLSNESGNLLQFKNNIDERDTIYDLPIGKYMLYAASKHGSIDPLPFQIETGDLTLMTDITLPKETDEGRITLEANNGTAPFTYQWSSGQSSNELNKLVSGNYSVTVTDAQKCLSKTTFHLQNAQTEQAEDSKKIARHSLGSFIFKKSKKYILPQEITFQINNHNNSLYLLHGLEHKRRIKFIVYGDDKEVVHKQIITCKPGKATELVFPTQWIGLNYQFEVAYNGSAYPIQTAPMPFETSNN